MQNQDSSKFETTQPMPLPEPPRQTRIDLEVAVIRSHHPRIAKAIESFWGHKDCAEYLQQLIISGGDGFGQARIGFKHEVLEAFIKLSMLHEVQSP